MIKNANIKSEFQKRFGDTANVLISVAPGRVNLIGDHTDYNGGFVLPMTIDRAVYIALRKRDDNLCKMYSVNFQEEIFWDLASIEKTEKFYWSNYVKGVMKVAQQQGYKFSGIEGVIYGDVPIASGLSSSAAVEVATINALRKLFNLNITPIDAIKLTQKAENSFIGVQCGIMDQFVSNLGRKNHALFIDCKSLNYQNIPVNFADYELLIIDSKVKRELVKSAYNERRASCEKAVKHFNTMDLGVDALRDVTVDMLHKFGCGLDEVTHKRASHVVSENQRVLDSINALQDNKIKKFGELLFASHKSLCDDYEVSCKELNFIIATAKHCGAVGARVTGAGFGGCALVLIKNKKSPEFIETLKSSYNNAFAFEPAVIKVTQNLESYVE